MASTIITSAVTAVVAAVVTGLITFALQERKLRAELRTEFMAEQAARALLENERWSKRSFEEISRRLRGFEEDDLRKILVRAGAVCFESSEGRELWGLISRNRTDV
jgi:hypothetical protein